MASDEAIEKWALEMRADLEGVAYRAAAEHLSHLGLMAGHVFRLEGEELLRAISPASRDLCDLIVRRILEHIFSADLALTEGTIEKVRSAVVSEAKEDEHGDHA